MLAASLCSIFVTETQASDSLLGWEREWLDEVTLFWQPPVDGGEPVYSEISEWTPAFSFNLESGTIATDGRFIYAGTCNPISVYDINGNFLKQITIRNLPDDIYRITTDGTNFYATNYERPGIFQIDFDKCEVVKVIPTRSEMYQISYIPTLDGGRGGFLCSNPVGGWLCAMDGSVIGDQIDYREVMGEGVYCNGTVYLNGKFYIYTADQRNQENAYARVAYEFDAQTFKPTGRSFSLGAFVGQGGVEDRMAARNIFPYVHPSQRTYLMFVDYNGLIYRATSVLVGESQLAGGITGYNLYRDNVRVNDAEINSRDYSFTDKGLAEDVTYNYELRRVVDGNEGSAVGSACVSLPLTTQLPFVDDFTSYTVSREHDFLRLPGNYWTIAPKLPEQKWCVRVVNGQPCIQFSYSPDLKYRQTLTTRPLTAPSGHQVRMSLGYAGNTYIYTLAQTECMNIDYSVDNGETWQPVDQIKYKSNTKFTYVEFDLTEKVAGKTFMIRFKGAGEEPSDSYNWQIGDIKIWDYVSCDVSGKVIFSGVSAPEGINLTFRRDETDAEYTAPLGGDGSFNVGAMQSGTYSVTVSSAEYSYTVEDFKVDRTASNYRIDVPGGYFTGDTNVIDVKLWANAGKSVILPLTNSGNADAAPRVSLGFGGSADGEAAGNCDIDAAPVWAASTIFDLPTTEGSAFYYNGSIYTVVQNYSTPQLRRYTAAGTAGDVISLVSENALPGNIAGYIPAGKSLYAVTSPRMWATPTVPAYLIPVDLAGGTVDEAAKIALPSEINGFSGGAYDVREDVFYIHNNSNAVYKISVAGELLKEITLPEMGYYGMGFDTFSAGGPYIYIAKSSNSPAGVTIRQYSLSKEQFTQADYSINDTPESIFNGASGMVMAGSCSVSGSTQIKSGYYSLIVSQTLSSRSGPGKAQCLVYPLFSYETWMSVGEDAEAVAPGRQKGIELRFDSRGLDDNTVKEAEINVSASNFSEPISIPVRLTVDYSLESEYPAVAGLTATPDDDYHAVLAWEQPATDRTIGEYQVYRNGRLLATVAGGETGFTDEIPAYGRQSYTVASVYDGGYRVVSAPVEAEVCDPAWGVPVANLTSRVVARRNVKLAWDVTPEIPDAFVDDFERYEPFDTEKVGEWTLIDGDGAWTFESNGVDYPNEGERMAGMVFNPSMTSPASDIVLPKGSKQALAFISGKTQLITNDDWLISPVFSMRRDGILRFEASTPYANYGKEQLMVGYSVTGTERDDFIWLGDVISVESGWSEFEFNIPAETRHIAFRHLGTETYILLIDNVYAGPAENMTTVDGYNIYRNGDKLNIEPSAAGNYSDVGLADGDYTYDVEVVYHNGATAVSSTDVMSVNTSALKNAPRDFTMTRGETTIDLEWKAPALAESEQLRYDNGVVANSLGGVEEAYAMVAFDDDDLDLYEGYSITNLHFHIAEAAKGVVAMIYRDGEIVRQGEMFVPQTGKFNDYIFDTPLLLEKGHTYMAGYKVLADNGHYPMSHGAGPGVAGKSDLYSEDGVRWYSIFELTPTAEFDINWNIAVDLDIVPDFLTSAEPQAGVIMPQRAATNAPVRPGVARRMPVDNTAAFAPDNVISFVGFNVYANDIRVNDAPLSTLSHSTGLPEADTDYYVTSVYSDGDEVASEVLGYTFSGIGGIMSDLKIYPNPVRDNLYVEGNYDSIRLFSLDGRMIYGNDAPTGDMTVIDMNVCPAGVYLLNVTEDGQSKTFRIIRR